MVISIRSNVWHFHLMLTLVKLVTSMQVHYVCRAGSGLVDPPTSPPSTSASGASRRCTALALPPSTSCRLTSLGKWLSLTRQWWGEPCLTWVQGQPSASQQGGAALRSRPVIIHFLSEKFAVDSLHMYPLHFTHWSRKLDICMLSKSNTIWIYKKNPTVFPTNKSCICHSCFPLNSVFFEAPCTSRDVLGVCYQHILQATSICYFVTH